MKDERRPSVPRKPGDAGQVAIALNYDPEGDSVPKVAATGRGHIAEQIIRLAFENNIKVREDADLAELLSTLDIGAVIPIEAYQAVAEILTYVYKANASAKQRKEQAP